MIKRFVWDKTTECHILLFYHFIILSNSAFRVHPTHWCEYMYWNSCLTGLSKWSAVTCCINYSGIKSRECVVSVISITSLFWILHSMMTTQTRMKMRELTLREKQEIWMLKEKRKSIRAIATTKGMEKSRDWKKPPATPAINNYLIGWENNSSWWPTNHKRNFNQGIYKGIEMESLRLPSQSPDLNLIEHEFHQLKRRGKTETPQNKQQLKYAALNAGKSISKDVTKSLVMSMCHRLTAVIVCKGSATK